jgi:hypothetical protein
MHAKLIDVMLNPAKIVFKVWKQLGVGSFKSRLDYDIFRRPHYAFCVYHAARQAHMLGLNRISVAEFGVAGGAGLLELETLAEAVEGILPVTIDVYGFDTGEGLPEPAGYRDVPYVWQAGFYKMDQGALRARLRRAHLILGDVKDTVPEFLVEHDCAPLGAAFFDLDFWSSTVDALEVLRSPSTRILPRAYCYFDDIFGDELGALQNDYVGQLAAIHDYNAKDAMRKLARIAGLAWMRRIPAPWNDKIFIHHTFDHCEYNRYIYPAADRQLPVERQ